MVGFLIKLRQILMKLLVLSSAIIRSFYKGSCWRMDKTEPIIYLTLMMDQFRLTPWILDVLLKYQVKLHFFWRENITKNPEILNVLKRRHQVGNHNITILKGASKSVFLYR